jgi:hypothetical protein
MIKRVVTAEEFLSSPAMQRPKFDVPVPELGEGAVIPIWGMTPRERTDFEDSRLRWPAKNQFRERVVFECARNEDGVKLFTIDQIDKLAQVRGDVFERLVNVAVELSGWTAADIETLSKN